MTRIDAAGLAAGAAIFVVFVKGAEISWHFQRFAELVWRRLP